MRPRRVRTAYRPALASLETVMPHRRTSSLLAAAATAVASLAAVVSALGAAPGAAAAAPIPIPLPGHGFDILGTTPADSHPHTFPAHHSDRLTVTVSHSGSPKSDGTFQLRCHPTGGNHHDAKKACAKLDERTRWGRDPFAPVPQGAKCTMIYGGPVTAHITGTWAGRPVDAQFRRSNGCEIERWRRFEPLLPRSTS
ncbi:SSI family serine proteinase inhibitor [Streptomyces sp. NPDC048650]|uniref:SSI family serine proteinase inhibitor n=1 Tax=unclassified Streptomyces TaxID=2593676 RepID=UPI00372377A9